MDSKETLKELEFNSETTSLLSSKMELFHKFKKHPERYLGKLAVVFISGIMIFTYLTTLIFGCIFLLVEDPFESKIKGIVFLLLLHIFIVFPVVTYFKALFKNPGYVNSIVLQKLELNGLEESELKDHPSKATWCAKCQHAKPHRAHHCSVCDKCILRMDHHCIFINCCVGENNHKYFVSFLFWMMISCFVALVSILVRMGIHGDFSNWVGIQIMSNLFLLFTALLMFYGFTATLCFFYVHVQLYVNGTTTIEKEFKEKYKVEPEPRKGKEKFDWINPFGG